MHFQHDDSTLYVENIICNQKKEQTIIMYSFLQGVLPNGPPLAGNPGDYVFGGNFENILNQLFQNANQYVLCACDIFIRILSAVGYSISLLL
jgi:hypothetical protein